MSRRHEFRCWQTAALAYVLLGFIVLLMLVPFFWSLSTSFKPKHEVTGANWLPREWHPQNYTEVFEKIPFGRYYFNSIMIALAVTLGQLTTSSMAAYGFSRLRWPGRDKVFLAYLSTLMIPGIVTLVPNFLVIRRLGWTNTYAALIVPAMFTAFGTFMLRQFMLTLPRELEDAAEIDGASHWRIFWDVIMPLARPGVVTLGIITFIGTWKAFAWPLVVTWSSAVQPLPIGLSYFNQTYGTDYPHLMAASLMAIVPAVIIFVIGQRFIVRGIRLGALKG